MKSKQWKSAGLICLVFIGGLSSCTNGGQGSKGDALDAQPIVGSVEILNGDSVWVCNLSSLKDTLVLPLSYFADELQIVKLDNRDEALVPVRNVIVSDNYILVWGKDQTPFKLFDKSGKYYCILIQIVIYQWNRIINSLLKKQHRNKISILRDSSVFVFHLILFLALGHTQSASKSNFPTIDLSYEEYHSAAHR